MTGYESKRAAAQDKLVDDDALTIAYQSGYYDGKKAAQPAQNKLIQDAFDEWWDSNRKTLSPSNPCMTDSFEYWAWEGWHAALELTSTKCEVQPAQEPVAHCEAGPEFCPVCRAETRSLALAAAVGYIQRNTPPLVSNEICNALKKSSPPQRPWVGLMRGARVEGDTVVIKVQSNNEARLLCSELVNEMGKNT